MSGDIGPIFHADGHYEIAEDVLRREGLSFLQRLAALHEDNTRPNKAAVDV